MNNNSFWWSVYSDLCAIAASFTLALGLLALIYGLNTFDFWPLAIVLLFVGGFWFFSSWIRRFG